LIEQLLHCTLRLQNRKTMVHCPGKVRVRERDAAERSGAQDVARGRFAICPKEKAGLRAQIGVASAIQNYSGDVARAVEASAGKHIAELLANAALVFAEGCREHFGSAPMALFLRTDAGIGIENFESEDDR
jgi:hypothetical protein